MWVCTTHLADAGITDEKELEKIVVLAGMHGDQVSKAEGSDGGQDVVRGRRMRVVEAWVRWL